MSNYIFGIHAVESFISSKPEQIIEVFIQKEKSEKFKKSVAVLTGYGVNVQFTHKNTLDKKTNNQNHQGIILRAVEQKSLNENDLDSFLTGKKSGIVLILDGITDPHNLGACLRSANGAGVICVVVPKDRSSAINAIAKKVASGAFEQTPVIEVTNLSRTMKKLQNDYNCWLVGTAGEAEQDIYSVKFSGLCGLVLGNEGDGMRRLTKENCDQLVKIPMLGAVSSLNVSVACGVCLYEILRQSLQNG